MDQVEFLVLARMNSFWGKEQVAIFAPWKDYSQDLGHLSLNHLLYIFLVALLAFACNATFSCLGGIFFHCLGNHSLPLLLCFKPLKPSLHVVQGPGKELNKSFCIKHHSKFMSGNFTWERSLFAPVEGVNWVRPGKHGKPRGDEELEVGWPRYSGWHSRASFVITANVKVFNCLVFTLFWLQLMLLLFSLLFNSIKCLSFLVDRIEVGFTYLRKKMMILVTIFPVGNWWLTTWEYLQNSNNPTVQLIIENSSAAPRAKKNGRNLSNDTSFPHFQMLFMCPKILHHLQMHDILS